MKGVGLYPEIFGDPIRIYVFEFAYAGCRVGEAGARPGFVSWLQTWIEDSLKRLSGSHSSSGD